MNNIDINKILFHCSSLPDLMTNGRSKDCPLGETAKTAARSQYIESVFGRRDTGSINKFTQKGIKVETDGIDLIEKVTGKVYFKNQETFSNEFITGTPDILDKPEEMVVDVKGSYNIWTFTSVTYEKAKADYEDQLQGYGSLTGMKKARLIYYLVNLPPEMIHDEMYKLSFQIGEDEAHEFEKNFIYDDIPAEMRIKVFDFDINPVRIQEIHQRVLDAREYLKAGEFIKPYSK
jgi:hypothetical protein